MLGTGQQHWSTLHVADIAAFFRRALEDDVARGYYVLGSGHNPTVAELTEAAAVAVGAPGAVPDPTKRPAAGSVTTSPRYCCSTRPRPLTRRAPNSAGSPRDQDSSRSSATAATAPEPADLTVRTPTSTRDIEKIGSTSRGKRSVSFDTPSLRRVPVESRGQSRPGWTTVSAWTERSIKGLLHARSSSSFEQEVVNDRRQRRLGEESKVAVVVDVQPRVWQQPGHDPRVRERDDRVIAAGEGSGSAAVRMAVRAGWSTRRRRAAGAGNHIAIRCASARAAVSWPGRVPCGAAGPVQLGGDRGGVVGVAVPAGGDHLGQDPRVRGDHQRAGGGADQDQLAAAPAMLEGRLLRETTAPGDAEDVELVVAEPVEQRDEEPREHREVVREPGFRRATRPGTSKLTTSMRGSRASTNGSSRSRLAPMPLQMTSGGPGPVPGRTETRTSCPRTVTRRRRVVIRRTPRRR